MEGRSKEKETARGLERVDVAYLRNKLKKVGVSGSLRRKRNGFSLITRRRVHACS